MRMLGYGNAWSGTLTVVCQIWMICFRRLEQTSLGSFVVLVFGESFTATPTNTSFNGGRRVSWIVISERDFDLDWCTCVIFVVSNAFSICHQSCSLFGVVLAVR